MLQENDIMAEIYINGPVQGKKTYKYLKKDFRKHQFAFLKVHII